MTCFRCEFSVKLMLISLKNPILTTLTFPSKRYLKTDLNRVERAHPRMESFYLRIEARPDLHQIYSETGLKHRNIPLRRSSRLCQKSLQFFPQPLDHRSNKDEAYRRIGNRRLISQQKIYPLNLHRLV